MIEVPRMNGTAERRELLRLSNIQDAVRIQNVLLSAVERVCTTSDRVELDDYISLATECLAMMPLVREHFAAEARRLEIASSFKLQGLCLQCNNAIHSSRAFCSAACESTWNASDPFA